MAHTFKMNPFTEWAYKEHALGSNSSWSTYQLSTVSIKWIDRHITNSSHLMSRETYFRVRACS